MAADLHKKILSGAALMVLLRLLVKSLGLISTMVLARLLVPDDFGLIAIVMAIYALIELINAFGFDVVLIQKQDATDEHYNTAWTIKVLFGVIAAGVMLVAAVPLAEFYQDPRLTPLAQMLSLMFIINGMANIGVVNFRKHLDFKKEFFFEFTTKVCSVTFTLALAYWLRSYWALVYGMVFNAVVRSSLSYILNSYRPWFSFSQLKDIYGFSAWLLLNNLLIYMNLKAKDLIIGRISGVGSAGLYSISDEIAGLPSTEFVASVNRATYPGYAKVSDDNEKLRALYLNVLSSIAMLGIPASIGIALVSPVMVPVLLGEKWLDAIPVIQILGFANALICLNTNVGYIFMAIGKPRLSTLYLSIRVVILLTLMIYLTQLYGYLGAAKAVLITSLIMFPLYSIAVSKILNVSVIAYIGAFFRPAVAAITMYALGSYVYFGQILHPEKLPAFPSFGVTDLILLIAFGGIVFVLMSSVMWLIMGKPDGPESHIFTKLRTKLSSS